MRRHLSTSTRAETLEPRLANFFGNLSAADVRMPADIDVARVCVIARSLPTTVPT